MDKQNKPEAIIQYEQIASLTDLPLATEQADETKGGAWKNGSIVLLDYAH